MVDVRNGAFSGMRIARETEVFGEMLPHCHFSCHISHWNSLGVVPGLSR
jgi:hypothetical protein